MISAFISDLRPEDARRALHAFSGLGKDIIVNGERETICYVLKGDLAAIAGDESDVRTNIIHNVMIEIECDFSP